MMNWFKRFLRGLPRPASGARRAGQRLCVEELEGRCVPSTSTNWSGYADSAGAGAVTAVIGSWTVPTVTGSGTSDSAAWVGIDGFDSPTVEQTGTAMDLVNGHAEYSAWYELFPNAEVTIPSLTVHPGDTINASVIYNASANDFVLSITDASDGNSFTTTQSAPNAQRSSAEWIMEAPSSNAGVLPLANFGSIAFTNAQATINGVSGPINAARQNVTVNQINMVNGNTGAVEATTSSLSASGSGFTVTFGAATPPPAPTPPPPAPTPPPTPTAPSTSDVVTVTSLTATVDPFARNPTVTFVATVAAESGSALPTGTVEILDGDTVLGTAQIEDVHGVPEVVFTVTFPPEPGVYEISVVYGGAGTFETSTSKTITVTVT
jgi:hypothetical protein